MTVKLLAEQHLEFLSLKGGCTGWSESILFKMPHCWKSHVMAHIEWIMLYKYLSLVSTLLQSGHQSQTSVKLSCNLLLSIWLMLNLARQCLP